MSSFRGSRINARTIVLDAARQRPHAPVRPVEPEAGFVCLTPTCRNVVDDAWEESGRYCARCAIERDLYDRESRRARTFPDLPF